MSELARFTTFLLLCLLTYIATAQEPVVTFEDWKHLAEEERIQIASHWSPYTENLQDLLRDIDLAFRKEFPEYDAKGFGNVHGGLMIVVERPFIFDKRMAPASFMGFVVRYTLAEPLPEGFEVNTDYVWAPENYLAFVESNEAEIRLALQNPSMTREDMLHALVGMNFDAWIRQCQERGNTEMVPGDRSLPKEPWWKF